MTFYATGWQSSFAGLADGQVATAAQDTCLQACQVTSLLSLDPSCTAVLYGGAAPGIVAGVTQFNVRLGKVLASGAGQVLLFLSQLTTSSAVSQTVWVTP